MFCAFSGKSAKGSATLILFFAASELIAVAI